MNPIVELISKPRVGYLLLVIISIMCIYSCRVDAQTRMPFDYLGFEASFGVRNFKLQSNLEALNNMKAAQEGGSVGVVFGNTLYKARIIAGGYYYSNANTPRTQELFESSASVNFYPMNFFVEDATLLPYIKTGVGLYNVKFFGKYLSDKRYEGPYEPFLGNIAQFTLFGGIGVEYRIRFERDFMHFFAESNFGTRVQSKTNEEAFSGTVIKNANYWSIGVSFGRNWNNASLYKKIKH